MIDFKAKAKKVGNYLISGLDFETRYHAYGQDKIEEFGQECFEAGRKSAFEECLKKITASFDKMGL